MASWVLSECGLRPLPRIYPKPQAFLNSNPSKLRFSRTDFGNGSSLCFSNEINNNINKERNWALKVSVPLTIEQVEEEINGVGGGGEEFDPGAPPPFKLSDIKAAIPKHCWVKNPWKSMSYVVRDVAVVFGLAAVAAYFNSWVVWPLYWFAQGTMFWALFVLGHDCGHGSFSNNHKLNSVVGHLTHSSILVPYHGWRISHRTHHQNHGHVENDESWHPLPEKIFKNLDKATKILRFTLPFPMLAYPFYLWGRSPGKKGSHFHPDSDLFVPNERKDIITSTVCWTTMVALLVGLSFVMGPVQLLKLYGIPYLGFVMWLDFVTYLHHHGHDEKLPWYRGKTEAAKPVLGKYYKEPQKSGPLPFYLLGVLLRSMKKDHYVSDTGDIVYYQTDPQLNGAQKS
ncbi:hypothetical protein RD792_005071 [Penstemon davidsonii]|uniref:Omega-3 fatty acid desaturase n=1 Tax=Penstemon davidsonii TaxID=160366 RepID=A0ABR0DJ75_9LAMI|nr:hypothetical protein RD792_005071 [Penstemon davidsonii]